MSWQQHVYVNKCNDYEPASVLSALPEALFESIKPCSRVIIKPNWVMESKLNCPDEWDFVITHPSLITAVLRKVLERLDGKGRISIVDGPMTEASFEKLLSHYPVALWQQLSAHHGIVLEIIDLRDHEWSVKNGIIVDRKTLPGDPRGKVLVDLMGKYSEFWSHAKSKRGYYGADYDLSETNRAHDGQQNLYSVSRTVIEGDVFINIPKLKTHRKAGITCCLKNLVGINTYKNYLPHHSEGGPSEGGDQFPCNNASARIEGPLAAFVKQHLLTMPYMARLLSPLNNIAKYVFGNSRRVVRNGSWYGNDTVWRMILDLNKILMYSNSDGSMRPGSSLHAKHYIGIVDAVIAGEGEGPLSPQPVAMGRMISGTNPVAIDVACALSMGFDPRKIPSVSRAFEIDHYSLCDFTLDEIVICFDGVNQHVDNFPSDHIVQFEPQHGWKGHIEKIL